MTTNCDHCGRATETLHTATTKAGVEYCDRAECRRAYKEDTGKEHHTFGELLHGNTDP